MAGSGRYYENKAMGQRMRQAISDRIVTEGQFNIEQSEGVSHVDSERRKLQLNNIWKALSSVHAGQAEGTARRPGVWSRISTKQAADEVRKTEVKHAEA